MDDAPRKKSPRAPSIPLDEAIERALRVYEKEKRHAAPTDVVAQDLGYKSANNGAALSVLASLRYYGLMDKPEDGKLAVSKDVEAYQYAPDANLKKQILSRWLKAPPVFSDLLEKYPSGLPSEATLRFDLINRGFAPVSAESVITVFKRSVDFAGYFENQAQAAASSAALLEDAISPQDDSPAPKSVSPVSSSASSADNLPEDADRIPVRLSGGRRAWLIIPTPFFEADKKRLKAQIDLLLSEDESNNSADLS